jgi:hypothetical protein
MNLWQVKAILYDYPGAGRATVTVNVEADDIYTAEAIAVEHLRPRVWQKMTITEQPATSSAGASAP